MNLIILPIFIFLTLGLFVGVILLQIFLSKKENKWLGLIIPGVNVAFSVCVVLFIFIMTPAYNTVTLSTNGEINETYTYNLDGEKIDNPEILGFDKQLFLQSVFQIISVILLIDWPVPILLIIYIIIRRKKSKLKELEKMKIQDL